MSWPGDDRPPAWEQPPQWQPPPRTSGLAIAALIASIVGTFFCFFLGIVGTILGIVALNEIGSSQGRLNGRGLAIAGIVIGLLGFAFFLLAFLVFGFGSLWTR
jgi:uncharacterized membrane protein